MNPGVFGDQDRGHSPVYSPECTDSPPAADELFPRSGALDNMDTPLTRDHPAYPFMRDGDGDVVCESGSRSVSPASSPSSPRASGTGCGPDRTATARRCGAIIPPASRVATVRINDGWTPTTTAGPANGRRRSSPDTATRRITVGRRVGAPGFVSDSEKPTSTSTRTRRFQDVTENWWSTPTCERRCRPGKGLSAKSGAGCAAACQSRARLPRYRQPRAG